MKPKLNGNLADLHTQRTTFRRNMKTGQYVEYIHKRNYTIRRRPDGTTYYDETTPSYEVAICGVNANGVHIAASVSPCESHNGNYFWQYADTKAVVDVLSNPENAYNYIDVKNGLKRA